MKIAFSACLMGKKCRYDGRDNSHPAAAKLEEMGHELIPVCPEMAGGLPCPRDPCELQNGRAISSKGKDCTSAYVSGAKKCLEILKEQNIRTAVLQPRSPSCGIHEVYDGSFSGRLIEGEGIFAKMCKKEGIQLFAPSELFGCEDLFRCEDFENELKLDQ